MDPSTKLCMGCMNELGSDGRCPTFTGLSCTENSA